MILHPLGSEHEAADHCEAERVLSVQAGDLGLIIGCGTTGIFISRGRVFEQGQEKREKGPLRELSKGLGKLEQKLGCGLVGSGC